MFFEDHLKLIYEAPDGSRHDPLRVDLTLVVETGDKLNDLILLRNTARQPKGEETGDVSGPGRAEAAVEGARAELLLAKAARVAFKLPEFPDCTDAACLETLYHFMDWMEGKGGRA